MNGDNYEAKYVFTVSRASRKEGNFLNDYRWIKEIGDGPHSEVRLVMRGDQPFAMKKYNLGLLKKKRLPRRDSQGNLCYDSTADKVRKEVEVHRRLLHPRVCRLFQIIQDREAEKIYLVMEYCAKGELATWDSKKESFVVNNKLKHPKLYYLSKIAEGLAYLHAQGVVHRDIKPMNILINSEDEVKIADFGCAVRISSLQLLRGSEGTYHFMAPQMLSQLFPGGYDGFKCDIWSLGVTFFALTFNRLPFLTEPVLKLFDIIIKGQYTIPDKSNPLTPIITRMLTVDPAKRPSAPQLVQMLRML